MDLKETDYLENHIVIPNQRFLMFTGIWPYDESSSRFLRIRCINFGFGLIILLELRILLTYDLTVDSLNNTMQLFLPTLSFVLVYNNTCNNSTTVRSLMDCIRFKWEKTMNDAELKSMQRYSEESKLYSLILICFFYLYIVILVSPSLIYITLHVCGITNVTRLVTPLVMELNMNNKLSSFSMLLFQYVLLFTLCTVGIAYCSMHSSFVLHACALFDITMIKIKEPFKENPDEFNWPISNNNCGQEHDWIVTIVKYYSEATSFVDLIKEICEKTIGIEAILALFFVILDIYYLLQLHDLTENMGEKLKNCIYISGTLMIVFAYANLGQKVIDHNDDVFTKCCQIPFYGLSVKAQKNLLLLLIKSMRPCNFSLKGAIVVSHEVFLNFLRISCSYAMVFHNIH